MDATAGDAAPLVGEPPSYSLVSHHLRLPRLGALSVESLPVNEVPDEVVELWNPACSEDSLQPSS